MKTDLRHLIAIGFVAVVAAGCASAPSRFYTLNSTATAESGAESSYSVIVGPVSIPAEVDRPQFTVQVAPNRIAIDEFNRWASPLRENIARAIAGDLSAQLGTPRVTTTPMASFNPACRVSVDVQRFESVPGKSVLVEVLWVVSKPAGGEKLSGHTLATETVPDDSYDALAAAHSRALARVSSDIAASIRAGSDEKP